MGSDLILVLGLVIGAFSIPAVVSAHSDGRSPRAAILVILLAAAMVAYAVITHPGGYRLDEIPDVFFGVVGRFIP